MKNYNYNYTTDYNFEESNCTILDVILFIAYLMILGNFLDGFEEHLRRPRNNDEEDDRFDYDMFDLLDLLD